MKRVDSFARVAIVVTCIGLLGLLASGGPVVARGRRNSGVGWDASPVVPAAAASLTISPRPTQVVAGDAITWTLTVQGDASTRGAQAVMRFFWNPATISSGPDCTGNLLACRVGTDPNTTPVELSYPLDADASGAVTVTVLAPVPGSYTVTAACAGCFTGDSVTFDVVAPTATVAAPPSPTETATASSTPPGTPSLTPTTTPSVTSVPTATLIPSQPPTIAPTSTATSVAMPTDALVFTPTPSIRDDRTPPLITVLPDTGAGHRAAPGVAWSALLAVVFVCGALISVLIAVGSHHGRHHRPGS